MRKVKEEHFRVIFYTGKKLVVPKCFHVYLSPTHDDFCLFRKNVLTLSKPFLCVCNISL